MKIAYIDAVGGIAGDMLLAGFLSAAGVQPEDFLRELVDDLGLRGIRASARQVRRGGFKSLLVSTERAGEGPGVDFHRPAEVMGAVEGSRLPRAVKQKAIAVFTRLARAEAAAHGRPVEDLHFHETGEPDAIIEVAGTLKAIHVLGLGGVICSPLPMGSGTVQCGHGPIPLPAPAVVEMLDSVPVRGVDVEGETVTPTGMALVKEIAQQFGIMPAMVVERTGIGAGLRDGGRMPNILRVFIGRPLAEKLESAAAEKNILIEANIDDMAPMLFDHAMEKLFEAGALDVYITPIMMKRGRPAHKLSILCDPNTVETLLAAVMRETTSSGARLLEVSKRAAPRRNIEIDTPWGPVQVKLSGAGDGEALNVAPEVEACRAIAIRHSIPLRRVIEEISELARRSIRGEEKP